MIDAKVNDESVTIKAAGTSVDLALDVLRIIKAIYDDMLERDTSLKSGASHFRSTIMLFIEDVLEYEKLEVNSNDLQKP